MRNLLTRTWPWAVSLLGAIAPLTAAGCRGDGQPIVNGGAVGLGQAIQAVSWVGNSFPADGDKQAVQRSISDIFVDPADSRVYTYSAFKGGGYRAVIYQGGQHGNQQVGQWVGRASSAMAGVGGNSITVADGFIYLDDYLEPRGPRISKITTDGQDTGIFFPLSSSADVEGIAVFAGELYVSERDAGEIVVFSLANPANKPRRAPFVHGGEMAIDESSNTLWVIQERTTGRTDATDARVVALDPRTLQPISGRIINDLDDPRDVAVDGQGRLWVADAGPDCRLHAYRNLTGVPVPDRTLGVLHGIFADSAGAVAPLKLNQPNAVGVDLQGNIYVNHGMHGLGAQLDAYSPKNELLWSLVGLGAIYDVAALDPQNGSDLFGKAFRFKMDWTKPAGEEWRFEAFTEGSFVHDRVPPRDSKEGDSPLSTTWGVRQIAGRRFVITTQLNGDGYLALYRTGDASQPDLAAPSVVIAKRGGDNWPPFQPSATTPWIWRDQNGDGRFEANEYESAGAGAPLDGDNTWSVDDQGSIWISSGNNPVELSRWRATDRDPVGNPIYRGAARETIAVPDPFGKSGAEVMAYVAATDTMFMSGFTGAAPRTDTGSPYVGTALARYDHFLDPVRRKKIWEVPLDPNASPGGAPRSWNQAGRYLFMGYTEGCIVRVFDLTSGKVVTTLQPAPPVYTERINSTTTAVQRTNGEYVAFIDDGIYRKVIMYRWNPLAPQGVAAMPATGGVSLAWSAPVEGPPRGYSVYRSPYSRVGYVAIANIPADVTHFTDRSAPHGATAYYRVSSLGQQGENTFSYELNVYVP